MFVQMYAVPLTRSAGENISNPVARRGYGEFLLCQHLKDFLLILRNWQISRGSRPFLSHFLLSDKAFSSICIISQVYHLGEHLS